MTGVNTDGLPVALLEDGTVLERPTVLELAERLGVSVAPAAEHYDLVIVGGGPAGLAAAVYGASEGLKTVLVEREAPGGQAGQSSRIENYLGFPAGLSGSDLARRATDQARRLGAELLTIQDAVGLRAEGAGRIVELSGGSSLSANCVLVASGVSYKQMTVPGFERLTGKGIYYGAALTEAKSCQDQHVVVIGAANSAGQAAVHFSRFAGRVTMLVRGASLEKSMSHYLIEQIAGLSNVEVRTGAQAIGAEGDEHLSSLQIRDADGEREEAGRRRLRVHRRRAAHRLARRRRGARRARLHPRRARRPARGLAAQARPVPARDVGARRLRRRRRPRALDEARRQRRRRGLDVGVAGPRVPGGSVSLLDDLRRVDLFDELTDAELEQWAAVAEPRDAEDEEVLLEQGVLSPGLLLLFDGNVNARMNVDGRIEPGNAERRADLDRRDRGADRGRRCRSASSPTGRAGSRWSRARRSSISRSRTAPCTATSCA